MATSFNGTTVTVTDTASSSQLFTFEMQSVTLAGGDVALIDITHSNATRRLQIPGLAEPLTLTLEGHSPDYVSIPATGTLCDLQFGGSMTPGTNPVPLSMDSMIFTSGETSGSIDSTYTISMTFTEGSAATITEGS